MREFAEPSRIGMPRVDVLDGEDNVLGLARRTIADG